MNHRQTVIAVARKLRRFSQRDVSEVLQVLSEIWSAELAQPEGFVRIEGLGKLYVQQQTLRTPGAIRATLTRKHGSVPLLMNRYYFRFQPTKTLYRTVVTEYEAGQEGDR
jgi:nucleoid DNA-binding protein